MERKIRKERHRIIDEKKEPINAECSKRIHEIDSALEMETAGLKKKLDEVRQEKNSCESEISTLRLFKINRKKELKNLIIKLDTDILDLEEHIKRAEVGADRDKQEIIAQANEEKRNIVIEVNNTLPDPEEPKNPGSINE